jgi:hypothetical protein
MPTIRVTPEQFSQRLARHLRNRRQLVIDSAREVVRELVPRAQQETRRQGAVGTGEYLNSWASGSDESGNPAIGNTSDHAQIVEFGTREVPPRPIMGRIAQLIPRRLSRKVQQNWRAAGSPRARGGST